MVSFEKSWFSAVSSLLFVAGSQPALSQDVAPATPGSQLEEVIVTANKREQDLNEVGLAINVLQGDVLKDRQINSLDDVANAVPGLIYTNSAENTPIYTLRGISFYDSSLGGYGAVSLNMDEVPLAFPILASHSAFDLERIEVLKGPQGTLFGQNATGGAVNFIAAKPTSAAEAGATLSYGRFNTVDAEGYVSGPLSDALKARFAGRVERGDAWQVSNSRPGDRNGEVDNLMARLLLDFEPTPGIRLQANLNGWTDKSDPQAAQYSAFQPGGAGRNPQLVAYSLLFSPENPRAADWGQGILYRDNSLWQGTVRADVDLNDSLTLTSLSSYTSFRQRAGTDLDGLPISIADHGRNAGEIDSFSQELRLSNGGAAGLRWIAGVNYENSDTDQIVDTVFSHASSSALGIYSNTYSATQAFENYAAFGNIEYDLGPTLTFKAGARYTDSTDEGRTCNADFSNNPTNSGGFFYNVLLGGRFGTYPNGSCFIINDQNRTINGVAPGAPGGYAAVLEEDNVSWRTGLDWKPADHVLVYGNVAKGYKAGSFPTATGLAFTSYRPVRQESVLAYELGLKAGLLGRSLQLSAAAFYYDYTDKQIRAKTAAPPFGIVDVLQNIPESSVKGLEVELQAQLTDGLSIGLAGSYIDATIDQFRGINGLGLAGDFSGTRIPFTPEYQFSLNPDYRIDLRDGVTLFMGASVSYRSSAISVIGGETNVATVIPSNRPAARIDGYTLVDLRAGVSFDDDKYKVSLFGNNVFDEHYWTNVFNTTDTVGRLTGMPVTYGVMFSAKY